FYVTDPTLDNTGVRTQYGFLVGGNGAATSTVNVGSNGAAFGVANNTLMTVLDILLAADAQSVNGVLYNGREFPALFLTAEISRAVEDIVICGRGLVALDLGVHEGQGGVKGVNPAALAVHGAIGLVAVDR